MEMQDNKMVLHGVENRAMVWDTSDVLSNHSKPPPEYKPPLDRKPPPEYKPPAVPELPDHFPAVEGIGHMQRPKHPTSYSETLAHLLKGNIASGMYAMGDAFKNGGLLLAPFLTVFLGIICVFNQHLLVNCANAMRERNKLNYYPGFDDTVELCFDAGPPMFRRYAKTGRSAVNFFIITAQLGFCCVYMVFVTSTTHQILENFGYHMDIHLNMVITLVFIMAFIIIRNLKYLAPVSLFATVTMVVGVALTIYISCDELPPIAARHAIPTLVQLPLFFGTVIYAYEGISLVLPLQTEMRHPDKFNSPLGVLNVGNIIVTLLLLIMGFIGYLKYGDDVQGSLTLNLPHDNTLSQCVKIAIAIGILLTYPIMFYVPVALIWPAVVERWGPFDKPVRYEIILRILLCLLTFVLAEVIPDLSLFISLVGAVSSTALALVFPPLCDISMRQLDGDFGFLGWRKMVNYLTLLIALFGFCTGTYFSLVHIVQSFGLH
ncbi:proton-coupled amino acid transporter-like protein CG1139 isoform X1 [Macrosteles quadrilineatus]|uniref:proton-coupled amino acid transporter-like protein CG1139 isoform X1 n=2 Tax=Macrosteles quadrilineatus TaxID=74068 RepID=UPI0023E1B40D|nr:proton-coupled amino acid transporter-like protein CG1139 isoform X1 [Macrosteles quadrilineatus]